MKQTASPWRADPPTGTVGIKEKKRYPQAGRGMKAIGLPSECAGYETKTASLTVACRSAHGTVGTTLFGQGQFSPRGLASSVYPCPYYIYFTIYTSNSAYIWSLNITR
jgi:hypothetical protein